jgi:hypothetical protein
MESRAYVRTESCTRSETIIRLTLALHTRILQSQRGSSQVVRSTNGDAHPNVLWNLSCVTYGAGDPD